MPQDTSDQNYSEAYESFLAFQKRMDSIQNLLYAKKAVATVRHFENLFANLKDINEDQVKTQKLLFEAKEYANSNQAILYEFPPINEVAIVLLSAYLESFIEELHSEAIKKLIFQRQEEPSDVLDALIESASDRYNNPSARKIAGLFKTCCIEKIMYKLKEQDHEIAEKKIEQFISKRNKIAHGEEEPISHKELVEWVNFVLHLAEALLAVVKIEVDKHNLKFPAKGMKANPVPKSSG